MPEADTEGQRFAAATPQAAPGFFLKGSHQLDWGMKNRLARVFDPRTGRTVMLGIDHGYFQGQTTGLERIDLSSVPLLPSCDALFCTRGILRSVIPAESSKPMVLRASGGPSILKELSDEQIAMDMEDALRHAGDGRDRGRHQHGSRREILPPRLPHHRRARRAICEDLFRRRWLR